MTSTGLMDRLARRAGRWLGNYLSQVRHSHTAAVAIDPEALLACLRPGDVLLVEGQTRVSVAIKYLTQSTWSHAALYAGRLPDAAGAANDVPQFLEADIQEGVRSVDVEAYRGLHCRICRPVGLGIDDIDAVIGYVRSRLGHRYDLKNVFDLVRYLLPTPPVPVRWRRRMLALGSGDPTRAICSTLIAQAFQSIRYPILPEVERVPSHDPGCPGCIDEILHIRHHSLYVPRDFDVSPYFVIVKPSLDARFDHRQLTWDSTPVR